MRDGRSRSCDRLWWPSARESRDAVCVRGSRVERCVSSLHLQFLSGGRQIVPCSVYKQHRAIRRVIGYVKRRSSCVSQAGVEPCRVVQNHPRPLDKYSKPGRWVEKAQGLHCDFKDGIFYTITQSMVFTPRWFCVRRHRQRPGLKTTT